jgi:hypothetical protein
MRTAAGSFQTGTSVVGEYYLHRLGNGGGEDQRADGQASASLAVQAMATPGMRTVVYDYVLDNLALSSSHAVNLLGRGLDEEAIIRNMYAAAPAPKMMAEIIEAAAGRYDLTGVPGIYRVRNGQWRIAADESDLLIPVRDAKWRIVAMMRRTSSTENRYRWMSCDGAPSGAPVHHAEPWNAEFRRAIYITEGQLKADVIACMLGFTTIGLAGCGSIPPGFATELREDYPTVGSIFIAFDTDVSTNLSVARGRERLEMALLDAGYRVHRVEWDAEAGKGLDDVLTKAVAA